MKTICIMCPIGCELNIDETTKTVTGNICPRGKDYGLNEITTPKRIVTSLIKTNFGTITVKTSSLLDKNLMFKCLDLLKNFDISNIKEDTFKVGDILLENILDTDVNIIVTGVFKN